MTQELFSRIIDEGLKNGLNQIHLCMFGEPLLHPEVTYFIKYAKNSGVPKVGIGTNGVLLREELSNKLIEAGLDILHVCLDGAKKETYEELRQGASYELVSENIEKLVAVIKKRRIGFPYLHLNIIQSEKTKKEVGIFVRKWRKTLKGTRHSKCFVKRYTTFAGQTCFLNSENKPKLFNLRVPCFALENELGIFWNGNVTACCYDAGGSLLLGSLDKSTINEIWNSEILNNLRDAHIKGMWQEGSLCQRCENSNKSF
jgi:radical SAM protein with 4Fe4S-binding SPASM domain